MTERVAHKTYLQSDKDDNATFVPIGCLRDIQRPGISRESVDLFCLEDDFDSESPGSVPKYSDITGTWFIDDASTAHDDIEELASRDITDDPGPEVPFRVIVPYSSVAGEYTAYTFTGWIKDLGPVQYTVKTEITRSITITPTSKPVKSSGTKVSFGI